MGRNPKYMSSFYKIMLVDFTLNLHLPLMFVHENGENLPKNTKLRISSGETWNVELERLDYETYRFNRGWTKFAVDVGLKMGEFVVFLFDASNSTFYVSLFGINGCGREIPVDLYESDEDDIESTGIESNDSEQCESRSDDEANPQLQIVLKKHRRSRVLLHREFAEAAGLMREKTVVLKYPPKQRGWPVLLDHFPYLSKFRVEMCKGWCQFRKSNGLVYGKTYLLEYIRDKNIIECKLVD